MSSRQSLHRALTVLAAAVLVVVVGATGASAHVTVSSPGAVQGGYATVTLKVPTESDTASTTGIKLQLPTDTPLASVSVQPKAGWSYKLTRTKLATPVKTDDGELTEAVSQIDWTAEAAGGIKPGEFDTFVISAGPLPDKDQVVFKAIQTYSDSKVVSWVEEATGSAEPEFPAPTLALGPTAGSEDAHGSSAPTVTAASTSAPSYGNGLAVTGVVLGGLALLAAIGALLLALGNRRRTSATLAER